MQYTVTITKKHCEGRRYGSINDCPLCAAIREQLPNFKLLSVGGSTLIDTDKNEYRFYSGNNPLPSGEEGWVASKIEDLKSGRLDKCVLTFWRKGSELNVQQPELETSEIIVKERIRYVSVPCSITEQTKELIMQ